MGSGTALSSFLAAEFGGAKVGEPLLKLPCCGVAGVGDEGDQDPGFPGIEEGAPYCGCGYVVPGDIVPGGATKLWEGEL